MLRASSCSSAAAYPSTFHVPGSSSGSSAPSDLYTILSTEMREYRKQISAEMTAHRQQLFAEMSAYYQHLQNDMGYICDPSATWSHILALFFLKHELPAPDPSDHARPLPPTSPPFPARTPSSPPQPATAEDSDKDASDDSDEDAFDEDDSDEDEE